MGNSDSYEPIDCTSSKENRPSACNKINKEFFEVEKVYVGENSCKGVWEVKRQLGEKSASGQVYLTCCSENCNYVMKQVYFKRSQEQKNEGYVDTEPDAFLKEVRIQKFAADQNLAPKVYDVFLNKINGAFVMESMKSDTAKREIISIMEDNDKSDDMKEEEIRNILDSIYDLIEHLHSIGVYHGDTHLNNFMRRSKDAESPWLFIDFGIAKIVNEEKRLNIDELYKDDYVRVYSDLEHLSEENRDYYDYLNPMVKELYRKVKKMEDTSKKERSEEEIKLLNQARKKLEDYTEMANDDLYDKEKLADEIAETSKKLDRRMANLVEDGKITSQTTSELLSIDNKLNNLIDRLRG